MLNINNTRKYGLIGSAVGATAGLGSYLAGEDGSLESLISKVGLGAVGGGAIGSSIGAIRAVRRPKDYGVSRQVTEDTPKAAQRASRQSVRNDTSRNTVQTTATPVWADPQVPPSNPKPLTNIVMREKPSLLDPNIKYLPKNAVSASLPTSRYIFGTSRPVSQGAPPDKRWKSPLAFTPVVRKDGTYRGVPVEGKNTGFPDDKIRMTQKQIEAARIRTELAPKPQTILNGSKSKKSTVDFGKFARSMMRLSDFRLTKRLA